MADRLQELHGHAVLVRGVGEVAVDAAQRQAGVDGRRVEQNGLLADGLLEVAVVVAAVVTAGREQRQGREHAGGDAEVRRTLLGHQTFFTGGRLTSLGPCAAESADTRSHLASVIRPAAAGEQEVKFARSFGECAKFGRWGAAIRRITGNRGGARTDLTGVGVIESLRVVTPIAGAFEDPLL